MGIVAIQSKVKGKGIVAITDSKGYCVESSDVVELLKAVAQPYDGDLKVAWDMVEFMKPICAKLPADISSSLSRGGRVIWDDFRLFYGIGKGKRFGVGCTIMEHIKGNFYSKEKFEADIFELKIYYPDEPEPSSLAEEVDKGNQLLATLKQIGVYNQPTTLTSPGAIYKEAVLDILNIPTAFDLKDEDDDMLVFASEVMREWRCCYQVGYFKEGSVWDYDKGACYPSILSRLPNLKYAKYIHSTDGTIPEGAYWGVMFGKVEIEADVSPIIHEDGTCYRGSWEDFITTDDWECIKRWNLGSFTPYEGWFFTLDKMFRPFGYTMRKLYGLRNGDNLQSMLAKLISVQIIGMFHEQHDDNYGKFYNPIYASMVTSKARVELCDFIYENELTKHLITVTVDGCLVDKEVQGISKQSAFGEWRVSPPSHALVVNQQFQWYGEKRPAGVTVDGMLEAINAHPQSRSWEDVDLHLIDHERDFAELPKNGRDLLANVYKSKAKTIGGE